VRPDGRYGVSKAHGETLRVGCGALTRILVSGRPLARSRVLSTLDTRDDRRARRIADEVVRLIHVEPVAVDLYAGRLDVIVADTNAVPHDKDTDWEFVHGVFASSRNIIGRAVMPETLAVSLRQAGDRWVTLYYYSSMAK
jgi:hypothetical protein